MTDIENVFQLLRMLSRFEPHHEVFVAPPGATDANDYMLINGIEIQSHRTTGTIVVLKLKKL